MMTHHRDDVRAPRHHRRRVQPGVEHAALRLPHQAPARVRRELPARARVARHGQARHGQQHQLVHERAGRGRRHARHRRRHLRARARRSTCAPRWTCSVVISNCPQINNPCNGFDPTPIRIVVDALTAMTPCSTRCSSPTGARSRAGSSARSTAWASSRSRCTPTPTATSPHVRHGRRGGAASARRRRPRATCDAERAARRPRAARAPTRSIPATASSSENADVRGRGRGAPGSRSSGRRPSRSARFGAKDAARALAAAAGVPLLPGHRRRSPTPTPRSPRPTRVGFPLLVKSVAGGGGIGMLACADADELADGRRRARCARAEQAFGDRARCSSSGSCAGPATSRCRSSATATGASSCSATATARRSGAARRCVEEAPAPGPRRRAARARCSTRPARCSSRCATARPGTVEFVVDVDTGEFRFLEVNTRLQVEHPRHRGGHRRRPRRVDGAARGRRRRRPSRALPCTRRRATRSRCGCYAEDPGAGLPPERRACVTDVALARRTSRVDTWVAPGTEVTPVLRPAARQGRRARRRRAPRRVDALRDALDDDARRRHRDQPSTCSRSFVAVAAFVDGDGRHRRRSSAHPIRAAHRRGARRRELHHGAGPARPARATGTSACRRAGRWTTARSGSATASLGNPDGRARARVHRRRARRCASTPTPTVCLTGAAHARPPLDGDAVPRVRAGRRRGRRDARARRRSTGPGCAPTCSSRGGLDVPDVPRQPRRRSPSAASAATAAARCAPATCCTSAPSGRDRRRRPSAPDPSRPALTDATGSSACVDGPHAAPDFFTDADIDAFYATDWEVHYNSARTGVRLVGPAAGVGAPRRRRGRAAPVEHPRHAVHRRRGRLHRRHADHARARRPEPRRLRVPGHGGRRRAVEARPARARRPRALRARRPRRRRRDRAPRPRRHAPRRDRRDPPAACSPSRPRDGDAPQVTYRRSGDARAARRVRADDARPRPAAPRRTRSPSGSRDAAARRRRRGHARASARCRCRSTRDRTTVDGVARRCSQPPRTSCPALDDVVVAEPHRAPAAVVGRPGDPRGDRALHARRCATTRRGARGTSSSSAASTGSTSVDDVRRIVFDAELPRARARRRVPRRAGRDAGRPAPSPRHDEVQPGAHVDAGERGRHRRRVPVHLRHGGARRLPVRRPHRAGVEPLRRGPRTSIRDDAVAAALLRPDPLVPGRRRRAARAARRRRRRAARPRHRRRHASRAPTTARSSTEHAARHRTRSARSAEGAFAEERGAWEAAGEFTRGDEPCSTTAAPAGDHDARRPARRRVRRRGAAARQRVAGATWREGDRVAPGDAVVDARGDEDGDRGRRAGRRHGRAGRVRRRRRSWRRARRSSVLVADE